MKKTTNLNNLTTNINKNHKKYINKVYFNNNGLKIVKSHNKRIFDEKCYHETYSTEIYYGNILVYCCEYLSINGGKLQKTWEVEYEYNENNEKEWYYDIEKVKDVIFNGFKKYWKEYDSKGRVIYKKNLRLGGGESFYKYSKNNLLYIKNIDGMGKIKYEKIYNLKEAK